MHKEWFLMMVTRRVIINIVVFLLTSGFLIALGMYQLVFRQAQGPVLTAEFEDSSGLAPRNDVALRGLTVGSVDSLHLTETGVEVRMILDPGTTIPAGSQLTITRRSPIGDLVVEITPGDGPPLADGEAIPMAQTTPAPDAGKTVEALADFLHSVPPEDISTVVSELADAVEGRGGDLGRLSVATADLPERMLEVEAELERLIEDGPKVTGTLAANAKVLADDITRTRQLMDILRDRRYDLLDLYKNGARFMETAGGLIRDEKANIACLISDFGDINTTLATERNLRNLADTLDLNHFFFGAVDQTVRTGKDGRKWFRVQMILHGEPQGRSYEPNRPPPDVYAGNACRSRYGVGVGPGSQPGKFKILPGSTFHEGH